MTPAFHPIPREWLRSQRARVIREDGAYAVYLTRHFIDRNGEDDQFDDLVSRHSDEASAIRAASWAEAR